MDRQARRLVSKREKDDRLEPGKMAVTDGSLSPAGFPFPPSNDDMEEGDPGSDSDFEIEAKKEVSDRFDLSLGPKTGSEFEPISVSQLRRR